MPTVKESKQLVGKLCALLVTGGSNVLSAICPKVQSNSLENWLSHGDTIHSESSLSLTWHWESDSLGYKNCTLEYGTLTVQNVYKVLSLQYDPLEYILPYTTSANVLVQCR